MKLLQRSWFRQVAIVVQLFVCGLRPVYSVTTCYVCSWEQRVLVLCKEQYLLPRCRGTVRACSVFQGVGPVITRYRRTVWAQSVFLGKGPVSASFLVLHVCVQGVWHRAVCTWVLCGVLQLWNMKIHDYRSNLLRWGKCVRMKRWTKEIQLLY